MKRITLIICALAAYTGICAQSITLNMTDGGEASYTAGDISYIDFTPDTTYVDLGLSVLWASCNLGATSPEASGYYLSWGETSRKTIYADSTYQFIKRDAMGYDKYTSLGRNLAGTSHDAAHVSLSGNWRMPTAAEIRELINSCTWEWGKNGTRYGYWIKGPSGASIFLPAGGYRDGRRTYLSNQSGYYWSDTYGVYADAYCLNITSGDVFLGNYVRWHGRNIRPVRDR